MLLRVRSAFASTPPAEKSPLGFSFTPSSHSLGFAIRKTVAHYFGATSAFHFVSAYGKSASWNLSLANFLLHYTIYSKLLHSVQFARLHVSRTKNFASWILLSAKSLHSTFGLQLQSCRSVRFAPFRVSGFTLTLRKIRKKKGTKVPNNSECKRICFTIHRVKKCVSK